MTHVISGIQIFPANHVYNRPITNAPIHASSNAYITAIGGVSIPLDMDVTTIAAGNRGIPYNLVTNATTTYMPTFSAPFAPPRSYAGPYPIPASPLIENGSDLHLLCLNTDNGLYYELDGAVFSGGAWSATSGGHWDLSSNVMPLASTNPVWADAADLPMLAGLILYDEVNSGAITHALRCAIPHGSGTFIWPASHADGSTSGVPPHGSRFRLKANFDISSFSATNQVILTALKTYGCFLSDQSTTSFRLYGMPDNRWNNVDLAILQVTLTAANFEVIDESAHMVVSTSMQAIPFNVATFPPARRRGTLVSNYAAAALAVTPTGYYRLDDASGSTSAKDSSGNSYNGAIHGGVTLAQPGLLPLESDTAMSFNGSTGYITLPNGIPLSGFTALTISCLIKPSAIVNGQFYTILSSDHASVANKGFELYVGGTTKEVTLSVGNGTTFASVLSPVIATNTTYRVVAVYDGANLYLYLNGIPSPGVALTGTIGTPGFAATIGKAAYASTAFFAGVIDELLFMGTALNSSQVAALDQATLSGTSYAIFPPAIRRAGLFPTAVRRGS